MSRHSGSSAHPLPPQPVETVRLFSPPTHTEELEICRMSDTYFKIIKKVYREGHADPPAHTDTGRLDLTAHSVLLLYTINDNTDLTTLWHIRVVYQVVYQAGDEVADATDYKLLSDQDAFTFQRLVTEYSVGSRFRNVSASALQQHLFKRATTIDGVGEVQLWWSQPRDSPDHPLEPPSPAPTGQSTGVASASRPGSRLSTQSAPSFRSVSIQTDQKGRELSVTMAEPPPLLVLFGKGGTSNDDNAPCLTIWRVDITELQCRMLPDDPRKVDLISYSSSESKSGRLKPFDVHVLTAQDEQSWNVCRIRPGSYWRYFERHACDVLTLTFQRPEDVQRFRIGLVELQAKALGIFAISKLGSGSVAYSRPPSDLGSRMYSRPSSAMAGPTLDPRGAAGLGFLDVQYGIPRGPADMPRIISDEYTPSFLQAPTVSESPDRPGMAASTVTQSTGRAGISREVTSLLTVIEEPRDGVDFQDDSRMRLSSLQTRPESPMSRVNDEFRDLWRSSAASQASSQGGWWLRFRSR